MKTVNAKSAPAMKNPHGVRASKLYDNDHAVVVHLTLEPGQSLKRHATPVDVFFYILEGTGVVEVGDERREVEQDTLIDSPAGIPHCWHNESGGTLRVLVAKIPRPTEATKVV